MFVFHTTILLITIFSYVKCDICSQVEVGDTSSGKRVHTWVLSNLEHNVHDVPESSGCESNATFGVEAAACSPVYFSMRISSDFKKLYVDHPIIPSLFDFRVDLWVYCGKTVNLTEGASVSTESEETSQGNVRVERSLYTEQGKENTSEMKGVGRERREVDTEQNGVNSRSNLFRGRQVQKSVKKSPKKGKSKKTKSKITSDGANSLVDRVKRNADNVQNNVKGRPNVQRQVQKSSYKSPGSSKKDKSKNTKVYLDKVKRDVSSMMYGEAHQNTFRLRRSPKGEKTADKPDNEDDTKGSENVDKVEQTVSVVEEGVYKVGKGVNQLENKPVNQKAQQNVYKAQENVERAQRGVDKANREIAKSEQTVVLARSKVEQKRRRLVKAQAVVVKAEKNMGKAQKRLNKG